MGYHCYCCFDIFCYYNYYYLIIIIIITFITLLTSLITIIFVIAYVFVFSAIFINICISILIYERKPDISINRSQLLCQLRIFIFSTLQDGLFF